MTDPSAQRSPAIAPLVSALPSEHRAERTPAIQDDRSDQVSRAKQGGFGAARAATRSPRRAEQPPLRGPQSPWSAKTHGDQPWGAIPAPAAPALRPERTSEMSTISDRRTPRSRGDVGASVRACQGGEARGAVDVGCAGGSGADVGDDETTCDGKRAAVRGAMSPPLIRIRRLPFGGGGAEGAHLRTGQLALIPPVVGHHPRVPLKAERDTAHEGAW